MKFFVAPSSFVQSLLRCLCMVVLFCAGGVSAQSLSITPITWGVIGLDSNNTAVGPDTFPVGARVCNVGGAAAGNVTGSITFPAGNAAAISLVGTSSVNFGTLTFGSAPPSQYTILNTPANCADFYFNVQITRAAASYNQTRQFVITASSSNAASVATPSPREVYVEKLLSQNRNSVLSISGPTSVFVGDTATYVFATKTAPGGYDEFENFIIWPNTIFRVLQAASIYATPVGGVNSTLYADACGWDAVPTSPTYRSCIGPANYVGGAGGTITTTFVLQVLGVGTTAASGVVHDFSGSSYHYNADYGAITVNITAKKRTVDLVITKSNGTGTVYFGTTTSYSINVTNSGPDGAVTTTISDPAVSGLTKQSVSCVASGAAVCPSPLTVSALEAGTMIIPAIPLNSTLSFSVIATVTAGSTGTTTTTVSNTVTVVPSTTFMTETNAANNTAVDTDNVLRTANVSITKTNGTSTVFSGGSTTYTLTVLNSGPSDASGSILQDPAVAGLSCTTLSCAVGSGAAVCPVGLTASSLASPGITLPTLPASSSLVFSLGCTVTATGF